MTLRGTKRREQLGFGDPFRAIFEQAHDAILIFDVRDEVVLEANESAAQLYGVTREELIGSSLREFSEDEDSGRVFIRQTIKEGRLEFTRRQRRRDGEVIEVEIRAMVTRYGDREAILSLNRDVTAARQSLETLRDTEQRFRHALAHIDAVVWTADVEGNATFYTGAEEMLGISSATAEELYARIHPDDRERVGVQYQRLFSDDVPFDAEFRWQRPDGRWVWLHDRARRTYEVGGARYVDGIISDVTTSKRTGQLQSALASFTIKATTADTIEEVLAAAVESLREALGCDRGTVLQYDAQSDSFSVRHGVGWRPGQYTEPIPNDPRLLVGTVFRAGGPVTFEDLRSDTRFAPGMAAGMGTRGGMSTIIPFAGSTWGILGAHWLAPYAVSNDEVAFLMSVASIVGTILRRRVAESEAVRARDEYEMLFNAAQEAIVRVGPDGRILLANPSFGHLVCLPVDAVIGRPILDLVDPRDVEHMLQQRNERLRGETGRYEVRFLRGDGVVVWAHVSSTPLYDASGNVKGSLAMMIDVTEVRAMTESLRRKQAELAMAQSLAHVGSFSHDLDSGTLTWSDELYRIADIEPQSIPITPDFLHRFLGDDRFVPDFDPAHDPLPPFEYERDVDAADGVRRRVHVVGRPSSDVISGHRTFIGTVRDVTHEREAEMALRDREAHVQLTVSRLPVVIWSTDADLNVTSLVGAGLAGVDAIPPELHMRIEDLVGEVPEAPDATPEEALRGRSVTFESSVAGRIVRVFIEPLRDGTGNGIGTVGIAFDVTQEKAAARVHEELLERVHQAATEWTHTFDSIEAAVVLIDDDRRVVRLNRAALRRTRFDAFDHALGVPLSDLGGSVIWAFVDAHLAAGETRTMQPVRVEDGDRRWDVSTTEWSTGGVPAVTIVAVDVTATASMEESLRRSERMSAVGSLVAGVAHEVRNPLFGISATVDALDATHSHPAVQPFTDALRQQLQRLNELMSDLLEYGRPVPLVFAPESIELLIASTKASTLALARQHRVKTAVVIDADVPPVSVDRRRVLQVLENLLKNAYQHSPENGTVTIEARVEPDGRMVAITVSDEGPGVRPADLPRIFEPFYTKRRGGTGLGLSLVQRFVEDHSGTIAVENRIEGGARMTVRLPVTAPVAEGAAN